MLILSLVDGVDDDVRDKCLKIEFGFFFGCGRVEGEGWF